MANNQKYSKEYNKKYYKENKEQEKKRYKRWVNENRDKRREIDNEFSANNRERLKKKSKKYYQENRDKWREQELESKFGLSLEDYKEILIAQNGVCAICGRPETSTYRGKLRNLAVDHDHETGKVRGLLCSSCNMGIGSLEDNIDTLRSAILYLTRAGGQSSPAQK